VLQGYVDDAAVRSFLLKNLSKQKDGSFAWRMNLPSIARAYPDLIGPNVNESSPSAALFVKGGDSDYIAEEHRAEILARFPNTQLKVVGNTGHWLHAEKPNVVARLIRNFVSDNV
jgi:esterase